MTKFIGCDAGYDESAIVLFGVGYDGTTSYRPGTRFAPAAMRGESYSIETYSPHQDRDLCDCRVHDMGDLELCIGNSTRVLDEVERTTRTILSDGKLPFMLGGEHLVSLGAFRAVHAQYPELHIVQFDAHADLREDYLDEPLSHACVMRRAHELLGVDGRIHQYGIRSGTREEFAFAKAHTDLHAFAIDDARELRADAPLYITIDIDVLDPSACPGTGTPEAGGASYLGLLDALTHLIRNHNVVGVDLVELAPNLDASGSSTSLCMTLLRELLLLLSNYPK